jgi:glycosyltransferase involved in cell wall biosynthesis
MNVSVVIATFNAEGTIRDCVESLLAQSYPREDFELLVVDNASTDGTIRVVEEFGAHVRLLREPTKGPGAARNAGVAASRSRLVAFIDADCVAHRDWLRNIVRPFDGPGPVIVGGRILARRPCNWIERFGETIHDNRQSIEAFRPPYVITMNCCMPMTVLSELRGFDDEFVRSQDVDLSYRAVRAHHRLVYQHNAVVYHRHPASLWALFRKGFEHGQSSVHVLRRHHDFLVAQEGRERRVNLDAYREIGVNLARAARGQSSAHSLCSAVFGAGKRVGKAVGSIRFGYLDL